jgi:uncharacterized membrane protein YkoI
MIGCYEAREKEVSMRKASKIGISVAALAAAVGGGVAWAGAGDSGEGTVTGPEADRARAAALAHLGGGTANAVERDSEGGGVWEVEVTKPDGNVVDVRLSADYEVVVVDGDSEPAGDSENE